MSTTQAPLLWVPSKTTSDVSYASSIRQTITQTYQESPDSYKDEIAALDRCRQDALRGSAGSDVTGRDLLYKYFGQLELLELRFPEVRVPFPWKDAFTGKEISQLSLAYEKASVIFNIAATLSSLAAQQNRTSTEGIRRAFHNFRCAAGMFTYINDNFLHAPSTDLSRDVVKVLVQLMIAQATEVFVERMTEEKEKKPYSLRARVSTQAAFLYGSVLEDVKDLANKGIFERSWTWLVQCKHKYFVSLAQYQRSLADSAASKHGEALTRLQIAESAAKDAQRFATSFSACASTLSSTGVPTLPSDAAVSLLEITKIHLTLCTEAKVSEQRDNDLIYHEAQPSEAALPPIEKSSVGEPIAIQEVYGAPEVQKVVGQDIFIRLVPLSVHQSASLYSEEKAKLVRTEGERCDLADSELTAALDFMNLPGSLDKFNDYVANSGRSSRLDEMAEPPPQVREWVLSIQQANNSKTIEVMWEELQSLREKTCREIETIERNLNSDAHECEKMRVKYDHLWEQQPTANFAKTWRADLKSHRETLDTAKKSDAQVDGLWQSAKRDIEVLAEPSGEAIRKYFTESLCSGQDFSKGISLLDVTDTNDEEAELTQMRNTVAAIQETISRLQAIKKERQGVFKDLKERIQADDISQLLILNRKAQNIEPALFAAELEKFRAHSGRISATLHIQTTAIQELTAYYKTLTESKKGISLQEKWTSASRSRHEATARFQRAFEAHNEIRSGLSKGIQFYHDIKSAIADLQRQINHFISSRSAERARMAAKAEAERERSASGTSIISSYQETGSIEAQLSGMQLSKPALPPHPGTSPVPLPRPPQQTSAWQASANLPSGPGYQSNLPPRASIDQSQSNPHNYTSSSISAPPTSQASPPPPPDPYASLGAFGSAFSNDRPQPTPPSNSQFFSGSPYPQFNVQQSYNRGEMSSPASVPTSKPALPPPPSPVTYHSMSQQGILPPPPQSQIYQSNAPQTYGTQQAYNPPIGAPLGHQYQYQVPGPASAHQHYPTAPPQPQPQPQVLNQQYRQNSLPPPPQPQQPYNSAPAFNQPHVRTGESLQAPSYFAPPPPQSHSQLPIQYNAGRPPNQDYIPQQQGSTAGGYPSAQGGWQQGNNSNLNPHQTRPPPPPPPPRQNY